MARPRCSDSLATVSSDNTHLPSKSHSFSWDGDQSSPEKWFIPELGECRLSLERLGSECKERKEAGGWKEGSRRRRWEGGRDRNFSFNCCDKITLTKAAYGRKGDSAVQSTKAGESGSRAQIAFSLRK